MGEFAPLVNANLKSLKEMIRTLTERNTTLQVDLDTA